MLQLKHFSNIFVLLHKHRDNIKMFILFLMGAIYGSFSVTWTDLEFSVETLHLSILKSGLAPPRGLASSHSHRRLLQWYAIDLLPSGWQGRSEARWMRDSNIKLWSRGWKWKILLMSLKYLLLSSCHRRSLIDCSDSTYNLT